ncbi:alkali-sensitive linkage protein 1 [Podospora fimiseda]|uniref:Alkali-sensitive linkage protein 1 n=1 Tax=Podospora fimiseda TaxID=252190 RepID=A0AAN7H560_9PEZI|nr:alkali-sensitive linkage protein 1 [Podospora fimiseda]
MLHQITLAATLAAAILPSCVSAGPLSSPKRGLVFTPNSTTRGDDQIWFQKPSSLTWYYNYKAAPDDVYAKISQSELEFVPMLWGTPKTVQDTSFVTEIKKQIKDGRNITNILSFNEPDAPYSWGGSNMDVQTAAEVWVRNIEPLREMGLRVGLPACTGASTGINWTRNFVKACNDRISQGGLAKNCSFDFITLHWYGGFEGLASHMGQYSAEFPGTPMWITEYNFADQSLVDTQAFYNISAEYFDRLPEVERYSLFGAFRSDVSNVGPNAAMLNNAGELTDIGAWYLGRQGTGVLPTSKKSGASVPPQVSAALLVAFGLLALVC